MFEKGDIIISRNQIEQLKGLISEKTYSGQLWLSKHKNYILIDKFFSMGGMWFEFMDDSNILQHFTLQQFENYFLSKREIRKLKLETLNV